MGRSLSPRRAKVKTSPAGPQSQQLLTWYDRHRRILPWRALAGVTPDPYKVWLSEIMLQQTTVATVGPYFQRFIKKWPTLRHLARAPIDDVMRMWAGLGYYRRARFLHACAKHVVVNHGGQFPTIEAELLELPGFGPYTAAAVAAIAFDQCANVVDGNVERVVSRLFAIRTPLPKAKAAIRAAAKTLLPEARFGDHAQALMDLGATICTPRNPKCDLCPWENVCQARALDIAEQLPRKIKAAARPVKHAVAFILFNKKGEILFQKRSTEGLLGGMMEVPSSPWQTGKMPSLADATKHAPAKANWQILPGKVKQVFSHFELNLCVAVGRTTHAPKGCWVSPGNLDDIALPSVMRKIVHHAKDSL